MESEEVRRHIKPTDDDDDDGDDDDDDIDDDDDVDDDNDRVAFFRVTFCQKQQQRCRGLLLAMNKLHGSLME